MDENNSTGLSPEIEVEPSGGRRLSCGTQNLHAEDEWELLTETMIPKNAERATTEKNQFSTEKEALSFDVLSDDHDEATLNESDIEVLIDKPLLNLESREMSSPIQIPTTITRNALGRINAIGHIYDFNTDTFPEISALNDPYPEDSILTTTVQSSDTKHISHDPSEKFKQLDIEPELQASILSDLVPVNGHAKYLSHEKKSTKSVEVSLMYTIKTFHEEIQFHNQMENVFSKDALELDVGTHVVIGVTWGTKLIITLKKNYQVGKNVEIELRDKLSAITLETLNEQTMPEAVDYDEDLSIQLFGDVLLQVSPPRTLSEASTILQKSLKLLKLTNKGKGKPISYTLVPLSTLNEFLNCNVQVKPMNPMYPEIINSISSVFESIGNLRLEMNEMRTTFEKNSFCVPIELVMKLDDFKTKLKSQESNLKSKLKCTIPAIRSGKKILNDLIDLLGNMNYYSLCGEIGSFLKAQNIWLEKIEFAEMLKEVGINYVGMGSHFDVSQTINDPNLHYVLFFGVNLQRTDPELIQKIKEYFINLIQSHENDQFVVIDLDVRPELALKEAENQIRICSIQNGNYLNTDVYGTYLIEAMKCYAKGFQYINAERPAKRVDLELKCPGSISGHCEDVNHKWFCWRCKEILSYGFDDYFYCDCGKARPDSFSYKCPSEEHETGFISFELGDLQNLLQEIPPMEELNILILGATGVGKSTWINAFINYLIFPSLEDAAKGKLLSVIASQFQLTDENNVVHNIKVTGKDDKNEDLRPGQSATQNVKAHIFPVGNTLIRLIDTPGVGDVRGVERDKENFANVLSYLRTQKELHGICVLLMPNEARLNVLFQFCIQELLTHLHRDAANNIVFCFTHSRSTFYKPGDSRTPLQQLITQKRINITLNHDTMYCVDNESFRFLSAVNHGVKFNTAIEKAFSESWNISTQETNRLIDHFRALEPHAIEDTITLNDARKKIISLTKSIADISNVIQENVSRVNWKRDMLLNSKAKQSELVTLLYIDTVRLENEQLEYPRTVCTNKSCITHHKIGDGSASVPEYITICHDHCYLQGVPVEIIGDRRLKECAAMSCGRSLTCLKCKCMWDQHMHITYIQQKVMERQTVKRIKNEMSQQESEQQQIEEFLQMTQIYIKEQEDEQKEIIEASVLFGHYLSKNAMLPYNDVLERYLDHLIEREEDKANTTRDFDLLQRLQNMKKMYQAEEKALKDAMSRSNVKDFTYVDFENLLQKLYSLKHNGQQLKQVFEVASQAEARGELNYEMLYNPQDYVGGLGKKNFNSHGIFSAINRKVKKPSKNKTTFALTLPESHLTPEPIGETGMNQLLVGVNPGPSLINRGLTWVTSRVFKPSFQVAATSLF